MEFIPAWKANSLYIIEVFIKEGRMHFQIKIDKNKVY